MRDDRHRRPDVPDTPRFWEQTERYLADVLAGRTRLPRERRRRVRAVAAWAARSVRTPRSPGYALVTPLASVAAAVLIAATGIVSLGQVVSMIGQEPAAAPVIERPTGEAETATASAGPVLGDRSGCPAPSVLETIRVSLDPQTLLLLSSEGCAEPEPELPSGTL